MAAFRRALQEKGWKNEGQGDSKQGAEEDDKVGAVFAALDTLRRDGVLNKAEFESMELYCALSAITATERFRDRLILDFKGNIKAAYNSMDDNASGAVSKEEFIQAAGKLPTYPIKRHMAEQVFRFLDLDGSGIIGLKEFEELRTLNSRHFLEELSKACHAISLKFESFTKAFEAINSANREAIGLREFIQGWKRLDLGDRWQSLKPRILFSFLDDNHSGSISLREWRLLEAFDSRSASRFLQDLRIFLRDKLSLREAVPAFERIINAAKERDAKAAGKLPDDAAKADAP